MITEACRTPVAILMDNATCYHRRRAAALIQGTDSPWLYTSGLCGEGSIRLGLHLQPHVVIAALKDSPAIDGGLHDACWKEVKSIPFENSAFTMLAASVDLRAFKDADSLYFGYDRRPIAGALEHADAQTLTNNDALEIFITDSARQGGIRFCINRNGESVAFCGTVDRSPRINPAWKGEWRCAVSQTSDRWSAEVAIPLQTLSESGIDHRNMQLNCMSKNLTLSGLETIFLTDPRYGANFDRCMGFCSVAGPPAGPLKERSFAVRLHFAETDDAAASQRVFNVAIQGRPVLTDFDLVKEAGGKNIALVKEFRGVAARDEIVLDLHSAGNAARNAKTLPVICAVEVVRE
jgi:hypothetical protein